jgi:hypothetical protein
LGDRKAKDAKRQSFLRLCGSEVEGGVATDKQNVGVKEKKEEER